MVTDKDITKLITAFKEIFVTKDEFRYEFAELRKDFSVLQTSVDNFAKKINDHDKELIIANYRLNKLEHKKSR